MSIDGTITQIEELAKDELKRKVNSKNEKNHLIKSTYNLLPDYSLKIPLMQD